MTGIRYRHNVLIAA